MQKDPKRYRLIFLGILWIFFVSGHRKPRGLSPAFLSPGGKIRILISELGELDFLTRNVVRMVV